MTIVHCGHELIGATKRRLFIGALIAIFFFADRISLAVPGDPAINRPAPNSSVDLHQHPTGGKTVVDISVGLYLTNLVAIDETRETFEIGGYLTGKWRDPRLVLSADPLSDNTTDRQGTREFRLEDLWTPAIEASNSISHKASSYLLEADRNGIVTYTERFDSVLSNDFDLRKFPFDTQVLRFEFEPFRSSGSGIQFASQSLPSTGISPEQHVELAGWRIKNLRYSLTRAASERIVPTAGSAAFEIVIQRQSGFYLWKILLPLLLMTMIPAVVFWTDPKEFLLSVPMTMLLSMVAFQLTVVHDLPRIGYVTFLDGVVIASFAFFFLSIVEITTVYLMQKGEKRPRAVKIHYAGRWAYPAAYFAVLLFLTARFFA